MQGLKPSQAKALERLYKRRFPAGAAYSLEQARELALLSRALNRQIGLLIDRRGRVAMVIAGEAASLYIPQLPDKSGRSLPGLRLLHTHLSPDGLSQEDLLDMLFLRLDAAIALNVSEAGEPTQWHAAWLTRAKDQSGPYGVQPAKPWYDCGFDLESVIREAAASPGAMSDRAPSPASAVLVSVSTENLAAQERNLDELAALARTAGLDPADRLIQRVSRPDPRLILGKGKLAELEIKALNANADILVFDGELSWAQAHSLAEITERKVLDRTQLILDIFAQHAETRAGKLQVELAQLAYALPRLAGQKKALDRLMGGIGGRGPGESRLETDRRKIRQRMAFLRGELEALRRQRQYARQRRTRNRVPVVALAGYTNAGKSTLLNELTSSHIMARDQLFATLDPTARRLRFPREREIIITDTVGFIRNLPRELREAFRATLEELESADLLVHVADASHPEFERQMASVRQAFEELELHSRPTLLVFNKCDGLAETELAALRQAYPEAVLVSALAHTGLDELLARVEQELFMEKFSQSQADSPE